jgi:flavin-dependent dehydrogenase
LKEYDVLVIGGGIAGSIAAQTTAEGGLSTLLLEKEKTPRNKVCSGVQLNYLEKIIGTSIPKEKLCKNQLEKVVITTPNDRRLSGRLGLLNFWRSIFDHWLNSVAIGKGVEFRDGHYVTDIRESDDGYIIESKKQEFFANYVIGADGLSPSSVSRRTISSEDFSDKITGSAMNYYFKGYSSIEHNTLYVFYRKIFSNLMFSWVYYKDDTLVIGTSSKENLVSYAESFYDYIKNEFDLKGSIIRKEGYVTQCLGGVCLGKDNMLLAGDAAGLLDLYRGVGMDIAAISGNLAGKSIIYSFEKNYPALGHYEKISSGLIKQLKRNNLKQEKRYNSDRSLEESLSLFNILKGRIKMSYAQISNNFSSLEDYILLPP